MLITFIIIFLLVFMLAWANGANDISKGIATLVGTGTSNAKMALAWGTFWTLMGGLAAIIWGQALIKYFGTGYLSDQFTVNAVFILSTMMGAAAWVLIATRLGLPVSTTHALLGALIGTVLISAGPEGLLLSAVTKKALLPLFVSPLIAIALCALLLLLVKIISDKVPAWRPGCCEKSDWSKNPFICAEHKSENSTRQRLFSNQNIWTGLHWLSSGLTSFARALNDVPKIAAFLILAVSIAPPSITGLSIDNAWLIFSVAIVMGIGSFWGGHRVLNVLAHRVTPIAPDTGLAANAGTAILVLGASPLGLPVSTTHVSTGALMGIRWIKNEKPQTGDALKLILFGWVITLPIAGMFAATANYFSQLVI